MERYLLDTNVISAVLRSPHGKLAARLSAVPGHRLCTSIIVAAELRYGAAKMPSPRLLRSVEEVLSAIDIMPFDVPADEIYAGLRAELERKGRPIAANDLLIAAHALALGCVVVTDDGDFGRVPGLTVENWLR